MNTLILFFEEPTKEFNVREVSRLVGISPASASKTLKRLAEESILKQRDERMLKLFKANLESEKYLDMKIFYNIRKIKESGLITSLNDFYLKPTIILFGSCATGLDTESSDVDLLVLSEKTNEFKNLKKFEEKINKTIQLFNVIQIKDLKNNHLINNIINGITIQGKIKWI